MTCSSGCATKDHASYGECLRAKGATPVALTVHGDGFGRDRQKAWDRELDAYAGAVRQGIQPAGTSMREVQAAVEMSNMTGTAFRADV